MCNIGGGKRGPANLSSTSKTPQEQGSLASPRNGGPGEQPGDDSSTGRVAHGSQGAVLRARGLVSDAQNVVKRNTLPRCVCLSRPPGTDELGHHPY